MCAKTMSTCLIGAYVLMAVTSLHAELSSVTPTSTTTKINESLKIDNKTIHFVDVIKNNLRRNNDDYVEVDLKGVKIEGETRRRLNSTEENVPLADPALQAYNTNSETTVFRSQVLEQVEGNGLISPILGKGKHALRKQATQQSNVNAEEERKPLVDNWKRLVDKSKRLRIYTSSPQIEPSSSMATTRMTTGRLRTRSHTRRPGGRLANLLHTDAVRARPLHPLLPLRSPGPVRAPPNADQLDMAPARGAYIHDLRLKGRFCHRNVLWPEGPKYDSKGNTIMPPFDPKLYRHAGKSFVETTKPLFVLPRCCNCCKKSVLGCQ